jgi:hypothetical protein
MRALQPCGTWAAYQRHLKNHEVPCVACEEACALRHGSAPMAATIAARRGVLAEAVGGGSYGGRAS